MSPELIEHLWDLRAYHANAVINLTAYADDAGPGEKHYRKRADLHSAHVVTIDALLALVGNSNGR
jgi:hypothetical protein